MTAPTHILFGVLWAGATRATYFQALASALGALLPDIDHPRSSIGRVFFFLSYPLNLRFGHRGLIHSFTLWTPLVVIGILIRSTFLQWLALGAISHILIDCFNTSGVKAFAPFTEKSVVCFKRDWRINTGSLQEIYVFIGIAILLSMMQYSYTLGGPRKLINLLAKSPKIMTEEFIRAGNTICYAKGKFRWTDGRLEEVNWLIIGNEGQALVYWNGEKLIRNAQHGEFLRATLTQTEQEWAMAKVQGLCTTKTDSFFFDGQKWHFAKPGSTVFGSIKTLSGHPPEIQIEPEILLPQQVTF